MKWVEIIHVLACGEDLDRIIEELGFSIRNNDQDPELCQMRIYRHHELSSDFTIHFHRESDHPDKLESPLALRLVNEMKQYGLSSYSIWVEADALRPE